MNVTKYSCEKNIKTNEKFSYYHYAAIVLIVVVVSMNILSYFLSKKIAFLKYFHPIENIKKIYLTDSKEDLNCIHGLRFFSALWIIAGHTLEWNSMNIYMDTFSIREQLSELSSQPFFRAHYAVETFFYLSGLLTSYVTLKISGGDLKRFKVIPYIFVRYLRLTPQLSVFMLLSTLFPYMFNGPLWGRYMSFLVDRCKTNWWVNMIYMQNLINVENIVSIY